MAPFRNSIAYLNSGCLRNVTNRIKVFIMKFTLVLTLLLVSLYAISAAPGPAAGPVPAADPVPVSAPEPTPIFGLLGSLSNLLIAIVKALSTVIVTVVG